MTALDHPACFKTGVRLIMRVWRNKDQQEGRRPGRTLISTGVDQWERMTAELLNECIEGERVYASLEARNVEKAIRVFKERQLAADYDSDEVRHGFYNNCFTRWLSCLGAPQASAETLFLFDCDSDDDHQRLRSDLGVPAQAHVHTYGTRSGWHVITKPFNPGALNDQNRVMLQKNSLLLVGWK